MTLRGPADFMAHALQIAERGRFTTFPNPRVGCVVARDGQTVGEGWHARAGEAHAEVLALRAAGERARGADLFVTLEPCSHHGRTPPCVDALVAAGIRKVWAATPDPNPRVAGRGIERLQSAGIEVAVGLLEGPARALNRGFVSRMERGRPFVTLKLAASLDARTAMASGESKWITGQAARSDAQRLRAEAGAVLTGSGTVLADDPQMSVRSLPGATRQPDRIVLDTKGRVGAQARIWSRDGARCFRLSGASVAQAEIAGVEQIGVALTADGRIDLGAALRALALHEVNHVLVECGSHLAGALLKDRLIDELICYLAPSLLGDAARGLARVAGLEKLDQRLRLEFVDVRMVGADLRITAVPLDGAS